MKKTIKFTMVLAIVVSTFFACEKDSNQDGLSEQEQKAQSGLLNRNDQEQMYSKSILVTSATGESEKALVIGTLAELENAFNGKDSKVLLKKITTKNNLFVPIPPGTGTPDDPADPSLPCWDEIQAIYDANIAAWQAQANKKCITFTQCIPCPNSNFGLSVLYIIKPNSKKCALIGTKPYKFPSFKFKRSEFESEAVANYILAN